MKNKTKKIGVTLLTAALMTTLAATSVNADNKDSKEWEYKEAELSLLTFPDIN